VQSYINVICYNGLSTLRRFILTLSIILNAKEYKPCGHGHSLDTLVLKLDYIVVKIHLTNWSKKNLVKGA